MFLARMEERAWSKSMVIAAYVHQDGPVRTVKMVCNASNSVFCFNKVGKNSTNKSRLPFYI